MQESINKSLNTGTTPATQIETGRSQYKYDDRDRLVEFITKSAAGVNQHKTEWVYDSLSRKRIRRESTWSTGSNNWQLNEVRKFVYDGLDVIQERDGTDRVLVSYTRAGNIGGLLSRTVRANTTENSTTADKSYFYHYDGGGNVVALTNASGQAVARYTYDAYGNLVKSGLTATDAALSDAVDQAQQNSNKYRFSTKEWHSFSGLYDYGFRFYNSGFGKWINRDPIGEAGGLNLYGFVGNNPITLVDEYGFSSTPMSVASSFGRGVKDGLLNGGMTFITSMIMAGTIATLMGSCAPAVPIITALVCAIGGVVGVAALVQQLQAIFDSDLCPEDKAYQLGLLVGDAIAGAAGAALGVPLAPKGRVCFVAGTLVAMADGSFKPIEEVTDKDTVLSKDEKTGEVKAAKVTRTFVSEATKTLLFTFSDGTKLEATPEHPLYIEDKGFVAAKHAGVGSSVVTRAGPALRVLDVQEKQGTQKVYNFEVEGTHTYFVTDSQLWVHNVCTPDKPFDNFDVARRDAFKKAGLDNPDDVTFMKEDSTGTIVEFRGPRGEKVNYDGPHADMDAAAGHDLPHVGWQQGGKKPTDPTLRANFKGNNTYLGPPGPARSNIKG